MAKIVNFYPVGIQTFLASISNRLSNKNLSSG